MNRVTDDAEATARIEAALYSAGRPLTIREIMQASGTGSRTKAGELLNAIMQKAGRAFRALEVAKLPDGSYVLQLKPQYSGIIRKYASRPILPRATLKTLSYIAYKQPVSSKELVETRGSGVYAHLRDLRQLDYISRDNVGGGRIKIYTTTARFQKYFGIHGDQDTLKEMLFAKVKQTARRGEGPGAGGVGGATRREAAGPGAGGVGGATRREAAGPGAGGAGAQP